jgi:REP element-mobilizing transposase RayT
MRRSRIKADGSGYYHCMSRIIERRPILGSDEREKFRKLMRQVEGFSGVEILTYSIMSTHWHVLLKVPEPREISDDELICRLRFLYEPYQVEQAAAILKDYRDRNEDVAAEVFKKSYTYRMYDLAEFFKTLKQRFSQYYNRKTGRCGTLWEQRFKSILVEGSRHALATMAAYIDLNPVRAGLVEDPKDYRYCGYAEAIAGVKSARQGLRMVMLSLGVDESWSKIRDLYRQHLFVQGRQKGLDPEGRAIKKGFSPEKVEEVLRTGGKLPMHVLLHCRVRYFSDGLVLGSKEFTDKVFNRYRDQFGSKRESGARPMRYGEWGGLCTMRDLRLEPVSLP